MPRSDEKNQEFKDLHDQDFFNSIVSFEPKLYQTALEVLGTKS